MFGIKSISEAGNLKGKRVLLRADFNVPILRGKVADDFRIKKTLPTLKFLKEKGAKVIIFSHIQSKESDSLKPVSQYLKNISPGLIFIEDYFPESPSDVLNKMKEGDVALLENLRKYPEEKQNDENFSRHLASLADIYVNNAFSSSHRRHTSIVGVPRLIPSYAGFLFQTEVENLSQSLRPSSPSLLVLGGAKFETKLPILKKCLKLFSFLFVGGALANDFFKHKGQEVGRSLVSRKPVDLEGLTNNPKIFLPVDLVVRNSQGEIFNKQPNEVEKDDTILDAGIETIGQLKDLVGKSNFILWNGPLGNYEHGFKQSTLQLAKIISESRAESVVGGGDTFAALSSLGILEKFSFVSTGGGAMLDFLANETLPGIEALKKNKE